MKTTKRKTAEVLQAAAECGVWLDAVESREKKKQRQKRQTRPISKLLNPLARSGGYSTAVALNFTQTKMNMPVTRQSTISSFFQPQSKMSKDSEECRFSPPSETSSTPLSDTRTGTKRKHETTESPLETKKLASHSSHIDPDTDLEMESGEVCKGQKKEQNFFHLIWGYQSDEHEPTEKRRPPEDLFTENGRETQKGNSEAAFHQCQSADEIQHLPEMLLPWDQVQQDSNYHQSHKGIFRQNNDGSLASVSAEDFQSQKNIRASTVTDKNIFNQKPALTTRTTVENQHAVKHATNPQKELELSELTHYTHWSPVKRQNKENRGHTSPIHSTGVSPFKRLPLFEKLTVFQKVKHYHSPQRLAKESLENEQDSFAMLFTQDSEGFRVIANRNQQTRHPLKDRTNSSESRDNWNLLVKPLEMEEDSDLEPEMLFTQDSQGNLVIKH